MLAFVASIRVCQKFTLALAETSDHISQDLNALTYSITTMSVGTVWRHEKVGRIAIVFRCLREESIYNVGASLYRLAADRWDER
jgi:hypothetical protein